MHSCKKSMSYLVVGVAYIHKEPPPVVDRTHRYELLQFETVWYSSTILEYTHFFSSLE